VQGSLIEVNPFIVVILHFPEICVIVCVCARALTHMHTHTRAYCIGEDPSRYLGENGQQLF